MENLFFYVQILFVLFGVTFILIAGVSMMYWPTIEDFLLEKGWIKWLNKKHERENAKLDTFLKEWQKRHNQSED